MQNKDILNKIKDKKNSDKKDNMDIDSSAPLDPNQLLLMNTLYQLEESLKMSQNNIKKIDEVLKKK